MSRFSNGMNNQENKTQRARRALPFFVEFVKFASGFSVIIAAALLMLHVTNAAMN